MKIMDCQSVNQQLDDYLDGNLSVSARVGFEEHVTACANCARALEQARAVLGGLAALPVAGPSAGFFDRALAKAAQQGLQQQTAQHRRHLRGGWFAGALAAGLSALVVGGLVLMQPQVGPSGPSSTAVAALELTIAEPRTFNLVFASTEALGDVSLTVDLPAGIELVGHPARRQVRWTTQLQAGKNVLPLQLVGIEGSGGEIVATLQRDDKQKVFNININLLPG
jgi:hypothetical protein